MSDTSTVIRHAVLTDIPALCAFGQQHIPVHYAPLIGARAAAGQVRSWWNPEHFRAAVVAGEVVIADGADGIVGVAQRGWWDERPVMWKLYVHPERRGTGLGPMLMAALIDDLPDDAEELLTEHFAANDRAGAFYEREGFEYVHTEPALDGDPATAVVWRCLDLSSRHAG